MNYIFKYDANTYELLEISNKNDNCKIGYIKEDQAVYTPCKSKEEAIKIYKSILREQINYLKNQKRELNYKLDSIKKKLKEVEND